MKFFEQKDAMPSLTADELTCLSGNRYLNVNYQFQTQKFSGLSGKRFFPNLAQRNLAQRPNLAQRNSAAQRKYFIVK